MAPDADDPLDGKPERAQRTLGILIKNLDDIPRARMVVEAWTKKQRP